jgi:hypothetical protein
MNRVFFLVSESFQLSGSLGRRGPVSEDLPAERVLAPLHGSRQLLIQLAAD